MAIAVDAYLEQVREKVEAGERLDFEDGLALMESDDLLALGVATITDAGPVALVPPVVHALAALAGRRSGRGLG